MLRISPTLPLEQTSNPIPFCPKNSPSHQLVIDARNISQNHWFLQMFDRLGPIVDVDEEQTRIVIFADSSEQAEEYRNEITQTLKNLSFFERIRLWFL